MTKPNPKSIDRLPPHSLEAEAAVLGCVLTDPTECLDGCVLAFGGAEGAVFYDLRHREIYETMVAMRNIGVPIDLISLQQWLKDNEMLEQCGGIAYLSQLQDGVPSAANLSYYLDILREKFLLRKMVQTCTGIVSRIYDYEGEVDVLLDEVERDILAIRPDDHNGDVGIQQLTSEALHRIETLMQNQGAIGGLTTGLVDLDRMSDGFHCGEMIVLAAYPSDGKSALASCIAVHNALAGVPVAVFSLEMHPVQIVTRAISSESRINLYDVRRGLVPDAGITSMAAAASRIGKSRLFIEQSNGMTINQIVASARRLQRREQIRLVIVDYLQLVSLPGCDSREQEVSGVSKGIKAMAMELGIPVLALSQLNDDGRLRESRAIGQDADVVWRLEPDGDRDPFVQPTKLIVQKSRDGQIGTVHLQFLKTFVKFESAAKVSDSDVPTNYHPPHNDP